MWGEGSGASYPEETIWKGTVSNYKVVTQIAVIVFSVDKTFQRFSHSPLPGTERKITLQMQVPFINIIVPYKRLISPWFLETFSFVCYFLKNNQFKTILMPKRHITDQQVLL